jgi:hypothetical protein
MVRQFPGLVDLFWVCPGNIPRCVLQALPDMARFRLHHYTFSQSTWTEALIGSQRRPHDAFRYLYSIGNLDATTGESTLVLVNNMQLPRLRRVYLNFIRVNPATQSDSDGYQLRQYECLALHGWPESILLPIVLQSICGDLSALRILKLDSSWATQPLPAPNKFTAVVTFEYKCSVATNHSPQYWNEITVFLRNLPRLRNLKIHNWDQAVPIASGLSRDLRTLDLKTLKTSFDSDDPPCEENITWLAELCPYLEELSINIGRSLGNTAEIAKYQALGRLPRLQRLELDLEIVTSLNTRDLRTWRGCLDPHEEEQLCDSLLNSAIDADLARSIFHIIDAAKEDTPGRRHLEVLTVRSPDVMILQEIGIYVPALELFDAALNRTW